MFAVSLTVASLRKVGSATRNAIAFEILRFLLSGNIFGRLAPVSYTHLDVYKRQLYDLLLKLTNNNATLQFIQAGERFDFAGDSYSVLWPDSVSYTHLDVYKRQVYS